jgi:rfaE bifunctional protein kinase chain/domain
MAQKDNQFSGPVFSLERLQSLLTSIRSLRIGVIGDFTLDGYWYADMMKSQISRETPLFPRPVNRETYSPGGAANVAWNLADLGVGRVEAFTVFGNDWRGEIFRQVLEQAGVRQENILVERGRFTPFYGKVVLTAHGVQQEDARLDFINTNPMGEEIQNQILENVEAALSASPGGLAPLNALVIADYQSNGVITPVVRYGLNRLAATHPEVVFLVDSRDQVGNFHQMIIKPNEIEASRLFFGAREGDGISASVEKLAEAGMLWQAQEGRPICITMGERGCLLCQPEGIAHIPAVKVPPPLDTVGAGDTFLAGLAAAMAAGAVPVEAVQLAILASAVTVRKLHITGTAAPSEIVNTYTTYLGK